MSVDNLNWSLGIIVYYTVYFCIIYNIKDELNMSNYNLNFKQYTLLYFKQLIVFRYFFEIKFLDFIITQK